MGELDCVACHAVDRATASRIPSRKAPDLQTISQRATPRFLHDYLADPQKVKPGTTMPDIFHSSEPRAKEGAIDYLVHFLVSRGGGPIRPAKRGGSPAMVERGRQLYNRIGCLACHGPQEGPRGGDSFVPLGPLAKKTTVDALARFLLTPYRMRPSGRMPTLWLTEEEAESIAVYLLRQQLSNPASRNAAPISMPGIAYEYFEIDGLNALPDFGKISPKVKGVVGQFSLKLPTKHREENFAIRYAGTIDLPQGGRYGLGTRSDDGSVLLIDGKPVVDNGGVHGGRVRFKPVELNQGKHRIELRYFNAGGGAELQVFWVPPSTAGRRRGQPIPASRLSHLGGQPMVPLGSQPFKVDPAKAAMGARMFVAMRCIACHSIGGLKPGTLAKPLAQLNAAAPSGCLGTAIAKGRPDYQLSTLQRDALRRILKETDRLKKPLAPAELVNRTLATLNCYACHRRQGVGGPSDPWAARYFTAVGDIDLGEEAKIPPALDLVGAKFKPGALERILVRGELHVRPYMATRMPGFEAGAVSELIKVLPVVDRFDVTHLNPIFSPARVQAGRKLVGTKGLACITCHRIAGQPALAVQGIDLATTFDRVRPEWFRRYLRDPASFKPGTRMPQFWPEGQTPFPDLLNGDTGAQIDSIWSYLSLKNSLPLPEGIVPEGTAAMEIIPVDRPIVHRTFMKGVGTRAILVGFPEKVNVAFDANVVRLAKIWRGRFFDQSGVASGRTDRFLGPLGTDILDLPPGPAFALLDDSSAPWPVAERNARNVGGHFKGYRFLPNRQPVFYYRLGEILIAEKPVPILHPGGAILERQFTFTPKGKLPAGDLVFLAAAGRSIITSAQDRFQVDGHLTVTVSGSADAGAYISVTQQGQQLRFHVDMGVKGAELKERLEW